MKVAIHLVVLRNSEEKMSNRGSADIECCLLDLGFCRQYSIVGGVGMHQEGSLNCHSSMLSTNAALNSADLCGLQDRGLHGLKFYGPAQ